MLKYGKMAYNLLANILFFYSGWQTAMSGLAVEPAHVSLNERRSTCLTVLNIQIFKIINPLKLGISNSFSYFGGFL